MCGTLKVERIDIAWLDRTHLEVNRFISIFYLESYPIQHNIYHRQRSSNLKHLLLYVTSILNMGLVTTAVTLSASFVGGSAFIILRKRISRNWVDMRPVHMDLTGKTYLITVRTRNYSMM